MDFKAATLMIRFRAADGTWKRTLTPRAGNGRIRSGYALIEGEPVKVNSFQYQVRYYEGRQAKYEPAGKDASAAEAKLQVLQRQLMIKSAAPEANLVVVEGPERKSLAETSAA